MKQWETAALNSKVPVYTWSRRLDEKTLRQLAQIAREPYVVGHVASMPDAHVANGVAVGTVFATEHFVVPGALGGDLGCGVSAMRFDFDTSNLDNAMLKRTLFELTRAIPTGDAGHRTRPSATCFFDGRLSTHALERDCNQLHRQHLGTLGGGNHFIELNRDPCNRLWMLIHSGSRGIGGAIAAHHLKAARSVGQGTIAALNTEQPAGQHCLSDCQVAFEFARSNRQAMAATASEIIESVTGAKPIDASAIDVHHNFVASELHDGVTLLIHRKGAIRALRGEQAVIPGSMATASYLVEGLGAPQSFASASHGAGRLMTRREARERIGLKQFERLMNRIVFDSSKIESLVEESPSAYRDVMEVLDDESDLVTKRLRLEPLMVLKG